MLHYVLQPIAGKQAKDTRLQGKSCTLKLHKICC